MLSSQFVNKVGHDLFFFYYYFNVIVVLFIFILNGMIQFWSLWYVDYKVHRHMCICGVEALRQADWGGGSGETKRLWSVKGQN